MFKGASERVDGPLLGESQAVKALGKAAVARAKIDAPLLLLIGPTVAGDEAITRAVHRASDRHAHPFIHVNCVQHQDDTQTGLFDINSEVIGEHPNVFKLADNGTLYLDGINHLSGQLQKELLETLGEIDSGFRRELSMWAPNVRVVEYVTDSGCQPDSDPGISPELRALFAQQIVDIPPLANRLDDLPILVDFFVKQYSKRIRKKIAKVSEESMNRIVGYSWPGNTRELPNMLERVVVLATDRTLEINEEFFGEGLRVDRYRLVEKLGEGGMGEVWRARHQLLARPVALKLIRTDRQKIAPAERLHRRFEREAQITAKLKSPHTIKLFDYGVTEAGAFYFVMELLEGMDLSHSLFARIGWLSKKPDLKFRNFRFH